MIRVARLVLHIGSWKTATTAIQEFLAARQDALIERGVLYPRSGREGPRGPGPAHHGLRNQVEAAGGLNTPAMRRLLSGLEDELRQSGCDTLLLSSETFMDMRRPEVLARYIEAEVVEILASFRPQADFLPAMYYTEICHMKIDDRPDAYLAAFDPLRLDYAQAVARWQAVWPAAVVRLARFEPGSAARRFPVAEFLGRLGVAMEIGAEENRVAHPTLPAQATLFLRRLNEAGFGEREFFRIFDVFHRNRDWFAPVASCFAPDVLAAVQARAAASNRALFARYCPGEPEDFAPPLFEDPKVWAAALGDEARVFSDLLVKIARRAASVAEAQAAAPLAEV